MESSDDLAKVEKDSDVPLSSLFSRKKRKGGAKKEKKKKKRAKRRLSDSEESDKEFIVYGRRNDGGSSDYGWKSGRVKRDLEPVGEFNDSEEAEESEEDLIVSTWKKGGLKKGGSKSFSTRKGGKVKRELKVVAKLSDSEESNEDLMFSSLEKEGLKKGGSESVVRKSGKAKRELEPVGRLSDSEEFDEELMFSSPKKEGFKKGGSESVVVRRSGKATRELEHVEKLSDSKESDEELMFSTLKKEDLKKGSSRPVAVRKSGKAKRELEPVKKLSDSEESDEELMFSTLKKEGLKKGGSGSVAVRKSGKAKREFGPVAKLSDSEDSEESAKKENLGKGGSGSAVYGKGGKAKRELGKLSDLEDSEESDEEIIVSTKKESRGKGGSGSVVDRKCGNVKKVLEHGLQLSDLEGSQESDEELIVSPPKKGGKRKCGSDPVVRSGKDQRELETDEKRKYRRDGREKGEVHEIGKKRDRLDVFDVTEDDLVLVDVTKSKKETKSEGSKRKRVKFEKKSIMFEKDSTVRSLKDKKKSEMKEDGSTHPISKLGNKLKDCGEEPIFIEGKGIPLKSEKSLSVMNGTPRRRRTERREVSLQVESEVEGTSKQEEKKKRKSTLTSEPSLSGESKKGMAKGGKLLTAKNRIREQIQRMVLAAGWTIDYRPRRSKEYMDAVYIDLDGHVHWSSLKAYFKLEKQYRNNDSENKPTGFTPIPEESLQMLTRLTKKKIEREKLKKKDNGGAKNAEGAAAMKNKHLKKRKGSSMNGKDRKSLKGSIKAIKRKNKVGPGNGVHSQQGRKSKKQSSRALLVRHSDKDLEHTGKKTILSWLIDSGTVSLSGKVKYMNKKHTRALLEGSITRDGIQCDCCSKIVTVSEFAAHSGSDLCQPFQDIFTETGVSLSQCQLDAWNKQEESERNGYHLIDFNSDDPNDDTCGICADGGDLICCDGCPSTFHQSCLDIQVLPSGDWLCSNCSCKFCGLDGRSKGEGDVITISNLLTCSLCEEKYHKSCIQENASSSDSNSFCTFFCGQKCREIFEKLQKIVGVKHELEAGLSWTLIRRSDMGSKTSLTELSPKVEINSRLAVSLTVMEECFLPIIDSRSGINMIHSVLYNCGSNCNRVNYSGFYTFVLERDDEVISAASIRIHGTQLAEMPFIGTRHIFRRKGMCRHLLKAIESTLRSLTVEKLVIPAISELISTWTEIFGFMPIVESQRQEWKSVNMLVFPGVDLLQKLLLESGSAAENITNNSVVNCIKLINKHDIVYEVNNRSDDLQTNNGENNSSDAQKLLLERYSADEDLSNITVAKSIEVEEKHDILSEESNRSDRDSMKLENVTSDESLDCDAHGISDEVPATENALHANDVESKSLGVLHGPVVHALGGESENCYSQSQDELKSADGMKSILPEPVFTKISSMEPDIQESVKGDVGEYLERNDRIRGIGSDLLSLNGHAPDRVNEHQGIDSNSVIGVTDGSVKLDSNNQTMCRVENKPFKISCVESDTIQCDETILDSSVEHKGSSEEKPVFVASEPDPCNSDVTLLHSSDTVGDPHTTFEHSSQGPGGDIICQDSEDRKQTSSTAFQGDPQSTGRGFQCRDIQMLWKSGSTCGEADRVPNTGNVNGEVAGTEHNPEAFDEDSTDCTSEVVDESCYNLNKCSFVASLQCKSYDSVPNSCNSSSLPVPPASVSGHHNADVGDNSIGAFPGESTLQASSQGNVLHTCEGKTEHVSIDLSVHAFPRGSSPVSFGVASKSIVEVSRETSKLCNNEELQEVPETSSICVVVLPREGKCSMDPVEPNPQASSEFLQKVPKIFSITEKVFPGEGNCGVAPVEPNPQASVEEDGPDVDNLKDEVAIAEVNDPLFGQGPEHETSEVISNKMTGSDSQVAHMTTGSTT